MGRQPLEDSSITTRLAEIHRELLQDHPGIGRLAVVLHDAKTDRLRTFAHSTVGDVPLTHYEHPLSSMPCLAELSKGDRVRVIHDLRTWPGSRRDHTERLIAAGYRSSLTIPLLDDGSFLGFLFYDSASAGYFSDETVHRLRPYSLLTSALVAAVLSRIRVLIAAVRATRRIGRWRDEETGDHLERMSRFTRVIAQGLAESHDLDDEYVSFLTLFAPLHDIGKIGVPDRILLKNAPLEDDEFVIMRSHVKVGSEIVAMLGEEFGFTSLPHVSMLLHIVLHHHEANDGSGYPLGLLGDAIPLEARIVRVADVFDALTSDRPYKRAWTEHDAFAYLFERARGQFDSECVAALATRRDEIREIRTRFAERFADANSHEGYSPDL